MKRFWFVPLAIIVGLLAMAVACGETETPASENRAPVPTSTPGAATAPSGATPAPTPVMATPTPGPAAFAVQELKTPHYVATSLAHGQVLARPPGEVTITFNFTLAPPSRLRVVKDGEPVAASEAISESRLVLSGDVPDRGSGTYIVYYDACWPDGSCHQGQFGFVVM